MAPEAWQAEISKTPIRRRAEYKRSVIEHGLDSEALAHHKKLLSWMADSLKSNPYLAGNGLSNADCAAIPYILRLELPKLGHMCEPYPAVGEWRAVCARGRRSGLRSSIACPRPTGARSRTLHPIPG
jgi:glutathione S-transferase